MPTDHDLEEQLAAYGEWLETTLGSGLRPPTAGADRAAVADRRRRPRLLAAVVAVVIVGAGVTVAVLARRDAPTLSVAPGTSQLVTTVPDATPPATGTGAPDAATVWAPVKLPAGMTLIDTSFGLAAGNRLRPNPAERYVQRFHRVSDDVNLDVTVTVPDPFAPGGGGPSVGTIHGKPVVATPSATPPPGDPVTLWWDESGWRFSVGLAGISTAQALVVLNDATLREGGRAGLDPNSFRDGLVAVIDGAIPAISDYQAFVIADAGSMIRVESSTLPMLPDATTVRHLDGVGDVMGNVVLLDDGTFVQIGLAQLDQQPTAAQIDAIISSLVKVTPSALEAMTASARSTLRALPEVSRVTIGDDTIVYRGDNPQIAVAACLRVASGAEECRANEVRPSSPVAMRSSLRSLVVDHTWVIYGQRLAASGLCSADRQGTLIADLQVPRVTVDGVEYYALDVPDSVEAIRSCFTADGRLTANAAFVQLRPNVAGTSSGSTTNRALVIGDSVDLAVKDRLAADGVLVDADVNRRATVDTVRAIIDPLRAADTLPDVVVVHLGDNAPAAAEDFDAIARLLDDRRRVVFVTLHVTPAAWIDQNNRLIRALPATHPNVTVLDWAAQVDAGNVPGGLGPDGFHLLSQASRQFYTDLVVAAIGAP